ncbi:hypothetical protein TNCV_2070711 [Trichonephila clavipes]|uniref:Uncharacterized protein n=1 Tax=Trichonephila clavipes TaxID=2585209 RepID=A0A8X7BD39_TRICX|nr:hypothetical protein TNCV_2070711 [Trichonephila clavipes]
MDSSEQKRLYFSERRICTSGTINALAERDAYICRWHLRKSRILALVSNVVPTRISSQSSRHCWKSPLPHVSALIQRDFGYVLGVQQTKQLPHVAKVDLVSQLGVISGSIIEQSWTTCFLSAKDLESEPAREAVQSGKEGQLAQTLRRCSAGYLKYRQCVLEECESRVISNTAPYHNTRCRTSVAVHNAAVQHPLSPVSSDSNPTTVVWQTDAIDHVGPSYPPASNGHISALQFFGFVQHDYRFT